MVFLCVSGAKTVKWLISLNGIVITDIICIDRTFEKMECVPNESAMMMEELCWRAYRMHRKRKDPYMTYGPSCVCFMPEKIGLMIIFENGERAI